MLTDDALTQTVETGDEQVAIHPELRMSVHQHVKRFPDTVHQISKNRPIVGFCNLLFCADRHPHSLFASLRR
jgi:hypothetical protein